MPIPLTARLLAVARHTYAITVTGPVPATPDAAQIEYLRQPDGFAAGTAKIDAALVGETAGEIIVGFRGTLPPNSPDHLQAIRDWASDLDALLVKDPEWPGRVHQGFLGALEVLWPGMKPVITALVEAKPNKPIYLTGHSKGGPVANLAAFRLRHTFPNTPIFVCTFAGARPGDPRFVTAYDAAVTHSVRYEYADDIVPHLPPSAEFFTMFRHIPAIADTIKKLKVGYGSPGELHFIDWNEKLVGDSPTLRFERFAHLAELMATFGFERIVADHSIMPGSGYAKGVGG